MSPLYPAYVKNWLSRPVHWRWARAQSLVADRRYVTRRRDDADTGRAVRYLRVCGRAGQTAAAARRDPTLAAAHALWVRGGPARFVIEARLLARQSDGAIALATGVPAEVVGVYEAIFFDVRPHLHHRDWVLTQAIYGSGAAAAGLNGVVLKKFAYAGGPIVLDAVMPYLAAGKDLFTPPLDLATPAGRLEQKVRLAVAVELLPDTPRTATMLMKIMLLVREHERRRSAGAKTATLVGENLDGVLVDRRPEARPCRRTSSNVAVNDTPSAPLRKAG